MPNFLLVGQPSNWAHNLLVLLGFWVSYNGKLLNRWTKGPSKWLTSLIKHLPVSIFSLCLVSFLDLPLQCLTLCSHVILLFIASPQWTTNDYLSHHSCERGQFRLFLTKEGPTLEMEFCNLRQTPNVAWQRYYQRHYRGSSHWAQIELDLRSAQLQSWSIEQGGPPSK